MLLFLEAVMPYDPYARSEAPPCKCGGKELRLSWQDFADGSRHIRAECSACATFLAYATQTTLAIAEADATPAKASTRKMF